MLFEYCQANIPKIKIVNNIKYAGFCPCLNKIDADKTDRINVNNNTEIGMNNNLPRTIPAT
jgi:hypothetical protein